MHEQRPTNSVRGEDHRPMVGLRERRKARMKAAIQQEALRLFRQQGYDATTVEQIAEAAEVSRATFFRYFPTKADLVLVNVLDSQILEAFRAQPAHVSPIQALRDALRGVIGELSAQEQELQRQRFALLRTVPELCARMPDNIVGVFPLLAEALAQRVRRPANDFAVLTFAGAMIGVTIAAWVAAGDDLSEGFLERHVALVDAGLAYLQAGLPL